LQQPLERFLNYGTKSALKEAGETSAPPPGNMATFFNSADNKALVAKAVSVAADESK